MKARGSKYYYKYMKHILLTALALAVLIQAPAPAQAQIYQYFDEDGTMVVTDSPHGRRGTRGGRGVRGTKLKPTINKLPEPTKPTPSISYHSVPKGYDTPTVTLREDVSYEYYGVSGSNTAELSRSTRQNGPYDTKEGRTYPAQTVWNLGWSYSLDYTPRVEGSLMRVAVKITDVQFISDIRVVLPALTEDVELQARDAAVWDEYFARLLEHEHDHVDIIRDSRHMDRALAEINEITEITVPYRRGTDHGPEIKRAIEEKTRLVGQRMSLAIKAENDEYDRITKHGNKHDMREAFFGE